MAYLDVVQFLATAGGTTDFGVASAVQGYQTPAAAGAANGGTYGYRAESTDLSQWEVGVATYSTTGPTLARTTVLYNSLGTTAKINFSAAPNVGVVELASLLNNAAQLTNGVLLDARLPTRLGTVAKTITDWNSATENGWYMASGATNAPTAAVWYIGEVVVHNALWMTQTVFQFTSTADADTLAYRRSMMSGVWQSWYRIRLSQTEMDTRYLNASNLNAGTVPTARLGSGAVGSGLKALFDDQTYKTIAGSGVVKLGTYTASASASLTETSLITSTYKNFFFTYRNMKPATNDAVFILEVSTDAGGTWKVTGYTGQVVMNSSPLANPTTRVDLSGSGTNTGIQSAGLGVAGFGYMLDPTGAAADKRFLAYWAHTRAVDGAEEWGETHQRYTGVATAINAVRWRMSTGNITSGVVELYGMT